MVLIYRDFITVGLLVRSLRIGDGTPRGKEADRRQLDLYPGPDVLLGRLQIFNTEPSWWPTPRPSGWALRFLQPVGRDLESLR